MPRAEGSIVIARPVAEVFAYVDTWSNATTFTQDLVRWEPVGAQTHGLGSTFAAAMTLGPSTRESTLEITRWEQDAAIGWEPRAGFDQRGLYTFAAEGEQTRVTLEFDVRLPGGLAGKMLGKTLEPMARLNLTKTLANLKRELEV